MVKKAPSAGAGERARTLRREMTEAERGLWQILRSRQTDRHRFRRQVPIGGIIDDFVCHEARLIVEIDGGQQVLENPQGVRAAIAENLQRVTRTDVEPLTPTPTLPHHGGGSESTPEDPADPAQLIADLRRQLAACRAERDAGREYQTATRFTHPPPRWGRDAVGVMPRTDPW